MASSLIITFLVLSLLSLHALRVNAELSDERYYQRKCPSLHGIVRSTMAQAVAKEARMGASIVRLFFHDCFVQACDGSVLLDDTDTFKGEKTAFPNVNSVRGFEVIDAIKSKVEGRCQGVVSCADILALAARDAVVLLGGPSWEVQLGRLDSRTVSLTGANTQLPPPFADLPTLIAMFRDKGLDAKDMTALSGGHTIGMAQCFTFRDHIYNESNIDPQFARLRQRSCPASGGDSNLAPLDSQPVNAFDNGYYRNLVDRKGLLHSDQELFNGGSQDQLVRRYSVDQQAFESDFAAAMIRMGAILPSKEEKGEIRLNCRMVN